MTTSHAERRKWQSSALIAIIIGLDCFYFSMRPAMAEDCGADIAVYAAHDIVSRDLHTSNTSSQEANAQASLNKYQASGDADSSSLGGGASFLGFSANANTMSNQQKSSLEQLLSAAVTHSASKGSSFLDDHTLTSTLDPQVSQMYKSCLDANNAIGSKVLIKYTIGEDFSDPSNDNVTLTLQNIDRAVLQITTSDLAGVNAKCFGPIITGTQSGATLRLKTGQLSSLVCNRGTTLPDGSYPGFHLNVFLNLGNPILVALSSLPPFRIVAPPHTVTAVPYQTYPLPDPSAPNHYYRIAARQVPNSNAVTLTAGALDIVSFPCPAESFSCYLQINDNGLTRFINSGDYDPFIEFVPTSIPYIFTVRVRATAI